MKVVLLMPFLAKLSGYNEKEKELCLPILDKVDCMRKFITARAELEVLWLTEDNHLTTDILGDKNDIRELNKEELTNYILQNDIDIIIAEGTEILAFIDISSIPVILHFGFIPENLQSDNLRAQRQKLQAFAYSDFFICHAEEQIQYLEINQKLLGLKKINSILAPPDILSFVDLLENHDNLNEFLTNPQKVPRQASLINKITQDFEHRIMLQRQELTAQRENELEWLRKAFTQEIKHLLAENEMLRQAANNEPAPDREILVGKEQALCDEPTHLETLVEAPIEALAETQTNEPEQLEEMELADSLEDKKLIPFEIHQAELKNMQNHIQDLEGRIQRYQGRWYYVLFFWFFDKLQMWLIRLPLVMLIYTYHLWTLFRQRCQAFRQPKSLMETQ